MKDCNYYISLFTMLIKLSINKNNLKTKIFDYIIIQKININLNKFS